jgi:hypothetical protein
MRTEFVLNVADKITLPQKVSQHWWLLLKWPHLFTCVPALTHERTWQRIKRFRLKLTLENEKLRRFIFHFHRASVTTTLRRIINTYWRLWVQRKFSSVTMVTWAGESSTMTSSNQTPRSHIFINWRQRLYFGNSTTIVALGLLFLTWYFISNVCWNTYNVNVVYMKSETWRGTSVGRSVALRFEAVQYYRPQKWKQYIFILSSGNDIDG